MVSSHRHFSNFLFKRETVWQALICLIHQGCSLPSVLLLLSIKGIYYFAKRIFLLRTKHFFAFSNAFENYEYYIYILLCLQIIHKVVLLYNRGRGHNGISVFHYIIYKILSNMVAIKFVIQVQILKFVNNFTNMLLI